MEEKKEECLIWIPAEGNYIEILGHRIDGYNSFENFIDELHELQNIREKHKKAEEDNKILKIQVDLLKEVLLDKMSLERHSVFKKIHINSIPKSKIKEKIEELENLQKGFCMSGLITECQTKIEVLQELMEEGNA